MLYEKWFDFGNSIVGVTCRWDDNDDFWVVTFNNWYKEFYRGIEVGKEDTEELFRLADEFVEESANRIVKYYEDLLIEYKKIVDK